MTSVVFRSIYITLLVSWLVACDDFQTLQESISTSTPPSIAFLEATFTPLPAYTDTPKSIPSPIPSPTLTPTNAAPETFQPTNTPTSTPNPTPIGGADAYVAYVRDTGDWLYQSHELFIDVFNSDLLEIDVGTTLRAVDALSSLSKTAKVTLTTWSPDGRFIAFFSEKDDREYLNVFDFKMDRIIQIIDVTEKSDVGFSELLWSPHGNWLIYVVYGGYRGVWTVDIDNGKRYWIGEGCQPEWSQDGKSVYYIPNCQGSAREKVTRDGLDHALIEPDRIRNRELGDSRTLFSPALEAYVVTNNGDEGKIEFLKVPFGGEETELILEVPGKNVFFPQSGSPISPDGEWMLIQIVPIDAKEPYEAERVWTVINIANQTYSFAHNDELALFDAVKVMGWTPDAKGAIIEGEALLLLDLQTGLIRHYYFYPSPGFWGASMYWQTQSPLDTYSAISRTISIPTPTPIATIPPDPTPLGGAVAHAVFSQGSTKQSDPDYWNSLSLFIDSLTDGSPNEVEQIGRKVVGQLTPIGSTIRLSALAWSPNGNSVAYFNSDENGYHLNIYDVNTKVHYRLVDLLTTEEEAYFRTLSWSPDGQFLLYADNGTFWTVDVEDGETYGIGNGYGHQWSIDGSGIYYHPTYPRQNRFEWVSRDGSQRKDIELERINSPLDGDQYRFFSPKLEAFVVLHANKESGNLEFLLVPLEGKDEELIAEIPGIGVRPDYSNISPDGKWLLVFLLPPGSERISNDFPGPVEDKASLVIINLAENSSMHARIELLELHNQARVVGWSPDGRGAVLEIGFALVYVDLETGLARHSYIYPFGTFAGSSISWEVNR